MSVDRYKVGLSVNGTEKIVECDDTYPDVHDWKSAVEFAFKLVDYNIPDAKIDLLFCEDWESEEYKDYDYVHSVPPNIM